MGTTTAELQRDYASAREDLEAAQAEKHSEAWQKDQQERLEARRRTVLKEGPGEVNARAAKVPPGWAPPRAWGGIPGTRGFHARPVEGLLALCLVRQEVREAQAGSGRGPSAEVPASVVWSWATPPFASAIGSGKPGSPQRPAFRAEDRQRADAPAAGPHQGQRQPAAAVELPADVQRKAERELQALVPVSRLVAAG